VYILFTYLYVICQVPLLYLHYQRTFKYLKRLGKMPGLPGSFVRYEFVRKIF